MMGAERVDAVRRAPVWNRLFGFERRWAEALFDAVLGIEPHDAASITLPAFESIDRAVFWAALERAPAPSFRFGLRGFVYVFSLATLVDSRWRRPFFQLARAERLAAIEAFDRDPRYAIRQMLSALKMLACFAYFDAPAARTPFEAPPTPHGTGT